MLAVRRLETLPTGVGVHTADHHVHFFLVPAYPERRPQVAMIRPLHTGMVLVCRATAGLTVSVSGVLTRAGRRP